MARQERDRLAAENAELRKQVPAPAAPKPPAPIDAKTKDDLATYVPEALTAVEARDRSIAELQAENERLRQQAPAPAAPPKVFTPFPLLDEVQELVDGIPDLSEWHSTEALQPQWKAAQAADLILQESPLWKDKPVPERLAEAVRIVKSNFGTPSAPGSATDPAARAAAIVDALPTTGRPVTVGALRSGESPASEIPDFHRMAAEGMSDEEIMARLP